MRVECERCHALVAADFEVDAEGVTVSCGACGGSFRALARPRSAPAVTDEAPGCVKCGAPATDEPACPRCGLTRDHAATWAAADPAPADELLAAWAAAVAAWDEPAVHDRASALALTHAALPWLARRYREVQRARPTDAVARARLDRIAAMTLAALKASAAVPRTSVINRRAGYLVLLLVTLLVAGGLFAATTSSQRRTAERRRAIPASERVPAVRGGPPSIERAVPGR